MNFATDSDLFVRWAEAVLHASFTQQVEHRYNAASLTKRASGGGSIQHIEGLSHLLAEHGDAICALDLPPVGSPRRDWPQTLLSDGIVFVRHRDLQSCIDIAEHVATDLRLHAA